MCITVVDCFESMFWRRRYEYTVDSTVPVVLSGIYSPAALCIQNRTQFIVLLCIALHPKNMQYTLLYILYSTRGGRNHFPIRQFLYTVPKINLNLRLKTEPVTAGADATVIVWFLGQLQYNKSRTYTVASAPDVKDSVFKRIFKFILGQFEFISAKQGF